METLVTIQLRFPTLDRGAIADHISPLVVEVVRAGGLNASISVQAFDPDEDDE